MRVPVTVLVFFASLLSMYGQTGVGLPVQFIQFFKTYNLVNPAGMGRDSTFVLTTGNKSLLGAFAGIRTTYANTSIRLGSSKGGGTRHILGANFINDKEGTYIDRNRASLMYSLSIRLSKGTSFNAGVAGGFINYSYKASDISGGGSSYAPNGDIGLWLQRKDFNLGISINQLFPSKLTPMNETYTIERYYNLIVDKTFQLNYFFAFKPALVCRWVNKDYFNLDGAVLAIFDGNFTTGVMYKYNKGVSICAGLDKLRFKNEVFQFMFSYFYPSNKLTYSNTQTIEVSLGFLVSKRSKTEDKEQEE